jgi:hypothetical protein
MKELGSFSLCATGGRGGGFGHRVGGCCLLEWQALSDPQNFLTRKDLYWHNMPIQIFVRKLKCLPATSY